MQCLTKMVTNLPLYEHMLLEKDKEYIKMAKDIVDIFGIFEIYWNHVDYSFLEYNIKEFGTEELKYAMDEYIKEFRQFEQNTTIQEYNLAAPPFPEHFTTVTVTQDKDPTQCKLHEVRDFKRDLVNQCTIKEYAILTKVSKSKYVELVLAFPPDAFIEICRIFNAHFRNKHSIREVLFRQRVPCDLNTAMSYDCKSQKQGAFLNISHALSNYQ